MRRPSGRRAVAGDERCRDAFHDIFGSYGRRLRSIETRLNHTKKLFESYKDDIGGKGDGGGKQTAARET
ncbi:hypothetical protein [Streptomyces massasporeus]|uniref:hypothetical protein n=1 Tax=Streptomyces massasporeus TaxID=67324 RepID=UPI00367BCC1F